MVIYVGWIDATEDSREYLQSLGVGGRMEYNTENKCFEYCECSYDTIIKLIELIYNFYPGVFTAVDVQTGLQLPKHHQVLWRMV